MAEQIIRECMRPSKVISVPLIDALNHVLAEDIVSDRAYPPINRVMMDGIALSFDAYQAGQRSFKISGVAKAGMPEQVLLNSNECLEIMTGAPLPINASLVIPYEDLLIQDEIATISSKRQYHQMQNIHKLGSDTATGELIIKKGTKLTPPHIGIAASFGLQTLLVESKPKVAIISTGDELIDLDQTPKAHELRRSNIYALYAALKMQNHIDLELFHLADDKAMIKEHYLCHREHFQMMLYSGGVSKGKFDFLPEVWNECGVECLIHGVKQRPGKPLWFGVDKETFVIGLPGNPISSLVCLYRYFLGLKPSMVKLSKTITFMPELTYFLPVKIEIDEKAQAWAYPLEAKNSGEFVALAQTDGFVELPASANEFLRGDCFNFYPWTLV
jgi:molybdopterin molybdotransferase